MGLKGIGCEIFTVQGGRHSREVLIDKWRRSRSRSCSTFRYPVSPNSDRAFFRVLQPGVVGVSGGPPPPLIIKKPLGHLNSTAHFQHVGKLDWHNDVTWRHYDVKLINLLTESVNVSPRNGKNNGKVFDKSGSLISVIYHDDIFILLLKKSLELRKSWQKRFVYKRMLRKQKNLQVLKFWWSQLKIQLV